jgi:hypothetical protein
LTCATHSGRPLFIKKKSWRARGPAARALAALRSARQEAVVGRLAVSALRPAARLVRWRNHHLLELPQTTEFVTGAEGTPPTTASRLRATVTCGDHTVTPDGSTTALFCCPARRAVLPGWTFVRGTPNEIPQGAHRSGFQD